MNIVSSKNMYLAESSAVNRGTTFTNLMEKAGTKCAEIIYENYSPESATILCGKGKNGGDGFVIARVLQEKGCNCTVVLAMAQVGSGDCQLNFDKLNNMNVIIYNGDISPLEPIFNSTEIFVDAIFGTGFKGALDEELSNLAHCVNAKNKPIISIDVPSGADCDSATYEGEIFAPTMTIAISALKPIHIIKPYCAICGKVVVADIDITNEDFLSLPSPHMFTLYESDIKHLMPKRSSVSNKGTYGHAMCVVGSYKMPGAGIISISGALRSGVGLVSACFPKSMYPAITQELHECLIVPCSENNGCFCEDSISDILPSMDRCNGYLIGCGMGLTDDTIKFTKAFLSKVQKPIIIDADGLNAIKNEPQIIGKIKAPVIITPHPGEMSRLTGKAIDEIVNNLVEIATNFAKKMGCIVVLKGANTVVTNGDDVYINQTGNDGLAKGGSGDLLAGIMVSLLAQGMSPFECAICAVYIHGDCADEVKNMLSSRGMLVSDMIEYLPKYFGKY